MSEVTWNEVECGSYTADLPLWEELAAALPAGEAIVELGCGAGRVVLHLARRFPSPVIGIEREGELVEAVRAKALGLGGDAANHDVRDFRLELRCGLVLAPTQLIQLLPGREDRLACLRCVAACMAPGGRAALAIVEELPEPPAGDLAAPLPDVGEKDGWIFSSLPLEPVVEPGRIVLRRLRQVVDPEGAMTEETDEVVLQALTAATLEAEAAAVGLRPAGRREIPATDTHVGSAVVLLEREA